MAKGFVTGLNPAELLTTLIDWRIWARDDQLPPHRLWRTWLFLGGRGAGKTRAGAEWIKGVVHGIRGFSQKPVGRIALVGETFADVRDVMIEGDSGILSTYRFGEQPVWHSSKRQLNWSNGAQAMCFSAEDPESLRGPQFEAAWCDELGKWAYAQETFDMLQFGLRLGECPRQLVTTTPRNIPVLKAVMRHESTAVTKAKTADNRAHLAKEFLTYVEEQFAGTRLGRQELDGELIEDRADALWSRAMFDRTLSNGANGSEPPQMLRVVVAVDPPASSHAKSDACGIVVAGVDEGGFGYVLEDATLQAVRPETWAQRAVKAYHDHQADLIVAEGNQGGEMVETVLKMDDATVPVRMVHATRGKHIRAEPVAALYAKGRIRHYGRFADLEDQMCNFGMDGLSGGRSPDRLDALVWAFTELMLNRQCAPKIRTL